MHDFMYIATKKQKKNICTLASEVLLLLADVISMWAYTTFMNMIINRCVCLQQKKRGGSEVSWRVRGSRSRLYLTAEMIRKLKT